jgi:OOP family OmpA-OmpF porin
MRYRVWIAGLVATLGLAVLVFWMNGVGAVEAVLKARIAESLKAGNQTWAETGVSGRTVTLSGAAPNAEAGARTRDLIAATGGVARIEDSVALVPTVSPFVWTVQRDGRAIRLTGSVPSEAVRVALAARLREAVPGATVDDSTRIARGHPPADAWENAARLAVDQIARLTAGTAVLTDRTLTVDGRSPDAAAIREQVRVASTTLPSGFAMGRIAVGGPPPVPWQWSVRREGSVVTLAGHIPAEETRAAMVEAVRRAVPGAMLTDQMQIADGAPAAFAVGTGLALARLADLPAVTLTLVDNVLSVEGRVAELAPYDRVLRALADRPAGLLLGRVSIAAPAVRPYSLTVERSTGRPLRIAGFVPDEDIRRALIARAGGTASLDAGDLRLAPGVPAGMDWRAAADFAVEQALSLRAGTVRIVDQALSIDGETADPTGAASVLASVRGGLPGGLRLQQASVRQATPATGSTGPLPVVSGDSLAAGTCQKALQDILAAEPLNFERNRTDLEPESLSVVERLARTLRACPDALVEIGGHTDTRGPAAQNERLSRQRADTVREALVQAGIPARRLAAVGYGGSRPVATNETDEGRARNRRIEFTVR